MSSSYNPVNIQESRRERALELALSSKSYDDSNDTSHLIEDAKKIEAFLKDGGENHGPMKNPDPGKDEV